MSFLFRYALSCLLTPTTCRLTVIILIFPVYKLRFVSIIVMHGLRVSAFFSLAGHIAILQEHSSSLFNFEFFFHLFLNLSLAHVILTIFNCQVCTPFDHESPGHIAVAF